MTTTEKLSIFYLDDDPDDHEFFLDAVSHSEPLVSLFSEAGEFLRAANNNEMRPSVIFLDLNLPGKDGHEVLKEIRSNQNLDGVPVIILSTARDHATIQRCWEGGADMYLSKFTSLRLFANAVDAILKVDWKGRRRVFESFVFKPNF